MREDDPIIPLGSEFLDLVREQEMRCVADFEEWLSSAGVKAPKTMDALGSAISYLNLIASCQLGCREGDHVEEHLVARATSNSRAAINLTRTGYYDEALGLVRQVGETTSLLYLFVHSAEARAKWKITPENKIRNEFSAGKVRTKLEELSINIPMDKNIYDLISIRFIHVNPRTTPQGHNPLGVPTMGGYFQEAGCLSALNHLGGMVGLLLLCAVRLINPPIDKQQVIDTSLDLLSSIGGINLDSIQDYFRSVRKESLGG